MAARSSKEFSCLLTIPCYSLLYPVIPRYSLFNLLYPVMPNFDTIARVLPRRSVFSPSLCVL